MKILGASASIRSAGISGSNFGAEVAYKNSNGEPVGGESPICCEEMIACGVGEMCRDVSMFFSLVWWGLWKEVLVVHRKTFHSCSTYPSLGGTMGVS